MIRRIIFFETHFQDFYNRQSLSVQDKIDYVLNLVRSEPRVPEKFLKHLTDTDGLYELRVQSGSNIFRIFCFFDAGQLVVLLSGSQKKTDKTPRTELRKALALKNSYFQQRKP